MNLLKKSGGFINFLKHRLKQELPGLSAHKFMAPVVNENYFRDFNPTKSAKKSAVLILLHKINDELSIVFTLRSTNISHSGQISFPGGRIENGETPEITALRETNEEIGINTGNISILGMMSTLFVPPSDSIITPVVGFIDDLPEIKINNDEVQEAFSIAMSQLLSNDNIKREIWNFKDREVEVPFWNIHHTTPLWGATAMILSELLELYRDYEKNKNDT